MNRMFFKDKSRKIKEPMELDITSLLDVLVILLVFLLKSYNASDLKLNLVDNLTVPDSDARKLGNHALIIQIDADKNIFVNNKKIGKALTAAENPDLLAELKKQKIQDRSPAGKKIKTVNLVFDKNLPYNVMKGIMHTSAIAGYTEFKFIVQGNF
jgi:biopolymer transport protein ExbD